MKEFMRIISRIEDSNRETVVGEFRRHGEVFTVHQFRNLNLNFRAHFLVQRVDLKGQTIWAFDKREFDGMVIAVPVVIDGQETVILALVGKGPQGKVESVVALETYVTRQPSALQTAKMKIEAAKELDRDYVLSRIEKMALESYERALAIKKAKEEETRIAALKVAKEAKEKSRKEKITALMSRPQIIGYTECGEKRYGVPVLDSEWKLLPHDTKAIIVLDYNQDDLRSGEPIESFIVLKLKDKIIKGRKAIVRPQPFTGLAAVPKVIDKVAIEKDGEFYEISVYSTWQDVLTARAAGMNVGSMVSSVDKIDQDGTRVEVFSITSSGIDTVGICDLIPAI